MKTLISIIMCSVLVLNQSAFALTTLDLLVGDMYDNPVDNLQTIKYRPATNVHMKNKDISFENEKKNTGDTIIIDLAEVVITSPFPTNSKQCILDQVPYPSFAKEELLEGVVVARFAFDDSGNIHVLEVNASDLRLENHVKNGLENLRLSQCMVEIGKDYYLRFIFKLY